jgi:hypothetical protein
LIKHEILIFVNYFVIIKPGILYRYSDGPWAGRPGFTSWQGQENFLFSTAFRLAHSLLFNEYQRLFAGVIAVGGVKLTTHLHLMLRSRMVEPYFYSPTSLHGVVFN